ncbi:MAG: flavodoxin family protein [Kineosporiaceae bacterium]|nr:flavodoxin family protein [Kineosporiaceae bacterium]MBK7622092.1 flavodoxin family protein [Kineosporiaceae bacterium]MBK8074402.1 flavodoxin family protein [Kineosporiaceae bacterium]
MKVHVVYDSAYGNTEVVATAIADVLRSSHEVVLYRVDLAAPEALVPGDVLVVGSPTQGGRATPALDRFLAHLPDSVLEGLSVATFDTRLAARWVRMFGYAAPRMAKALVLRDAVPLAPAEGFLVEGREGPLVAGERERAAQWAAGLALPVTH